MKSFGWTILPAIVAAVTNLASAAPNVASLVPDADMSSAYSSTFLGSFWDGQKVEMSGQVTLKRTDPRTVSVETTDGVHNSQFDATLAKDGTLSTQTNRTRLEPINTTTLVLAALSGSRSNEAVVDIPVQVGPEQTLAVHATVTVARAGDGSEVIHATGTGETTLTYAQYTMPTDVSVAFAAAVSAQGFRRSELAVSELVHAGPRTQTMTYRWSLKPTN